MRSRTSVEPWRRVAGVEVEYGYATGQTNSVLFTGQPPRYIDCGHSNCWWPNGSRRYNDISGPEAATAECTDPWQMMHLVEANHQLMRAALYREGDPVPPFLAAPVADLFANNGYLDDWLHRRGTHLNFQLSRTTNVAQLHRFITAFLVTNIIVFGSGQFPYLNLNEPFRLSPRARSIEDIMSGATTRARPLINTRLEHHAFDSLRLHVTSTPNTHILPRMVAVEMAAYLGILAYFDTGRSQEGLPEFMYPIRALHTIDAHPDRPQLMKSGQPMTALDVQRWYFDRVWSLIDSTGAEADRLRPWVLEWGRYLDRLAVTFDPEYHFGMLDWATKQCFWRRWLSEHPRPLGVSWEDPWFKAYHTLDLDLHRITRSDDRPSRRDLLIKRFGGLDGDLVEWFKLNPPQNTRARVRAWLLEVCHPGSEVGITSLDWGKCSFKRHPCPPSSMLALSNTVTMPLPLNPNPPAQMLVNVVSRFPGARVLDKI